MPPWNLWLRVMCIDLSILKKKLEGNHQGCGLSISNQNTRLDLLEKWVQAFLLPMEVQSLAQASRQRTKMLTIVFSVFLKWLEIVI